MAATDFIIPVRWIHVISGVSWFGEIVVINLALLPSISKLTDENRKKIIVFLFPKIFQLASLLSVITIISGGILAFLFAGTNMQMYFGSKWGISILIGGILGTVLTIFHLFIEEKVGKKLLQSENIEKKELLGEIHQKLKIIPRVGLAIATTILLLMMYAAHGF